MASISKSTTGRTHRIPKPLGNTVEAHLAHVAAIRARPDRASGSKAKRTRPTETTNPDETTVTVQTMMGPVVVDCRVRPLERLNGRLIRYVLNKRPAHVDEETWARFIQMCKVYNDVAARVECIHFPYNAYTDIWTQVIQYTSIVTHHVFGDSCVAGEDLYDVHVAAAAKGAQEAVEELAKLPGPGATELMSQIEQLPKIEEGKLITVLPESHETLKLVESRVSLGLEIRAQQFLQAGYGKKAVEKLKTVIFLTAVTLALKKLCEIVDPHKVSARVSQPPRSDVPWVPSAEASLVSVREDADEDDDEAADDGASDATAETVEFTREQIETMTTRRQMERDSSEFDREIMALFKALGYDVAFVPGAEEATMFVPALESPHAASVAPAPGTAATGGGRRPRRR
jgi:hypothetical protein